MEFERIGTEIFVRSKPHMGENVSFSARRICWPPPPHALYRNNQDPYLPIANRPPVLPLQPWKDYHEVRTSLYQFYNDPAWCVDPAQRGEMLDYLRRWGEEPSRANCWPTLPWPDQWKVTHPHPHPHPNPHPHPDPNPNPKNNILYTYNYRELCVLKPRQTGTIWSLDRRLRMTHESMYPLVF